MVGMSCISYCHFGCFGCLRTVCFGRPHSQAEEHYLLITPKPMSSRPATLFLHQPLVLAPCKIPLLVTPTEKPIKGSKLLYYTTKHLRLSLLPHALHTSPDRQPFLSTSTPSDIYYPFIFNSVTTFFPFMLGPCRVQAQYERAYFAFLLSFISYIYTNTFSA
jgi:hypothetical protein